jgi:hypothetical protein
MEPSPTIPSDTRLGQLEGLDEARRAYTGGPDKQAIRHYRSVAEYDLVGLHRLHHALHQFDARLSWIVRESRSYDPNDVLYIVPKV